MVFVAAEAVTDLRDKLTEAVTRAFANTAATTSAERVVTSGAAGFMNATNDATNGTESGAGERGDLHEVNAPVRKRSTTRRAVRRSVPKRRKLAGDYLAAARAAWTPSVNVTPAWVREVTGCSRGLSSKVAADLKTELAQQDTDDTTNVSECDGKAA